MAVNPQPFVRGVAQNASSEANSAESPLRRGSRGTATEIRTPVSGLRKLPTALAEAVSCLADRPGLCQISSDRGGSGHISGHGFYFPPMPSGGIRGNRSTDDGPKPAVSQYGIPSQVA